MGVTGRWPAKSGSSVPSSSTLFTPLGAALLALAALVWALLL